MQSRKQDVIRFALSGVVALGLAAVVLPTIAAEQLASRTVAGVDPAELQKMMELNSRPKSIPFPEDNPYSAEKAELGKMLFFDPRLSGANLISCASCHNPSFGWEDGQPTGAGHGMNRLGRHTPTILNLAWGELFMWDGRMDSLEEQALGPIQAGVEMAQPLDELIAELQGIEGYPVLFEAAFPGEEISGDTIGMAIATYERTVVSNRAPFDLWIDGDENAISESAKRGFVVYNTTANCVSCHSGWNMTDDSFHDIGLASDDVGRAAEMNDMPEFKHAFKTPGLRNIVQRAPYMHDGSLATLSEVIDHYADGFAQRPSLSDEMKPFKLSAAEKQDLIAFLETLTSDDDPVEIPILPN
ncbi:cytochrome-c peroxidase [Pelagibius sp. Alg239-R121]|uniref:cytochrome-c peroxidase n=1 Tax=Pelagibius sp. Alg239-R121 TaxID=2993448 RepID=UPI0024A737BE|nr:cytochrome c peroxidase [Pelagibius sp. Alg239-R121]